MRGLEAQACDFFWENGWFERRTHPSAGDLIASTGFAAFDGETLRFDRLEPALGEHSVEVLRDYGLAEQRIAELAETGVIFRR
jgi:crotonobetainyl-CoA:carnitine CoA-transferase CaiB-like acyl-CoA transferase